MVLCWQEILAWVTENYDSGFHFIRLKGLLFSGGWGGCAFVKFLGIHNLKPNPSSKFRPSTTFRGR
jgi:hypothetical protein